MVNKVIIQTLGSINLAYAVNCVSSIRSIEENVGKYIIVRNPHVENNDVVVDIVKNKASITCRVFLLAESSLSTKQILEG